MRHVLLQLGDVIFREGGKQGHPLQNWASQVRLRQDDRHRHRRRGSGPAARPGLEDEVLQGQLLRLRARRRYDSNWLFDSSWNAADELNLSIGQGNLNVTPLQLAVGYSAIANGGTVVTPHVVDAIQSPGEPTRIQPSAGEGAHQHRRVAC